MSEEIDFSELNPALLDCQKHLNPADPQKFTAKATLKSLADAGLSQDGIMPNGLRAYIGAVLKVLDLQATNESLDKILRLPEVQITLKSAIEHAEKVYNSKDTVKDEASKILNGMTTLDAQSKEFIQSTVEQSLKNKIKEEASDSIITKEQEDNPKNSDDTASSKITAINELDLEDSVSEKKHFCSRCGWDTSIVFNPINYSQEDKEQFLYCLLGGTPFQKTFSLLDEKMLITFSSLTTELEDSMYDQLRIDLKKERFSDITSMNYAQIEYETVLALKEIKASGISLIPEKLEDYEGDDAVRDYCKSVLKSYVKTSLRKRLISEAYLIFRKVYLELLNEVSAENFYKPA